LIFTSQRPLAVKRPATAGVFIPKCSMALAKTLQTYWETLFELVSNPQIRLKSKAQTDEKAQHTR